MTPSSKNRHKTLPKRFYLILAALAIVLASPSLHAQIKNLYDGQADDLSGVTSLMSAVASNDVSGVKFFSKSGTGTINQKNFGGATALHIACREGNFEIVKILVENGADVNVTDNEGWTPLMRAAVVANREIIELLLAKGAQAASLNSAEESVIFLATSADCNDCLTLLFDRFNFAQYMNIDSLKSQLTDSFVIAKNHENQPAQEMIAAYLDRVAQLAGKNSAAAEIDASATEMNAPVLPLVKVKKKFVFKSDGKTVSVKEQPIIEEPTPIINKSKGKFTQQEMNYPEGTKFKFVVGEQGKSAKLAKKKMVMVTPQAAEMSQSDVVNITKSDAVPTLTEDKKEEVEVVAEPKVSSDGVAYKFNVGPQAMKSNSNKTSEAIEEEVEIVVQPKVSADGVAYKFNVGPKAKKRKVIKKAAIESKPAQAAVVTPSVPTTTVEPTAAAEVVKNNVVPAVPTSAPSTASVAPNLPTPTTAAMPLADSTSAVK